MSPSHKFLPKNFAGGFRNWRLVVLHAVARALGVLVHVEGFPYGSRRNHVTRTAGGGGGNRSAVYDGIQKA